MTRESERRRQATPIELAALLAESVCVPGPGEAEAVAALAAALDARAEAIAEELLYLRAFAVDFAVLMTLGDGPAKDQILGRYYEHWRRIDAEAEGTIAVLEERLREYAAAIGDIEPGQGGLARHLGVTMAARCGGEGDAAASAELVVFAARLFAVLYDEVTALLTEVEILALDEDNDWDED